MGKTTFMKMQKKRMPTTPSNFSRSGGNSGGDDAQSTPERRFFHEGEAVAPDQQSCVVRPASKPRLIWDMLAIFVLLYDLVSVPLDAFRLQQTVTLYWLLDIFASFATAVYVNGKLYMRHWAKAYCRSWFVFDVLVLVPDIFVLVGDAQNAYPG
ncbi:hypothetical protein AK812_SmicGene16829 [Symbiodinium microadriaticum]|uniref:Ion transport domain-containing protein n=1 Tax=Symbiodinium microadriaticum TaxID=2951 RepID=A0A1Q9DZD1_SYMMI|nr:hypothetical protein AK812_SmicGene16829 [Symbiodinium microadriaticum]